jgi:IS605 OrfB family transposase
MRTFQARLNLAPSDAAEFAAYAELFGRALRTLHARRAAGTAVSKPAFTVEFGLTARQYNAVCVTLDGVHDAVRERLPGLIEEDLHRASALRIKIAKTDDPFKRHHRVRRLKTIQARIESRRADLTRAIPSVCFGSRKLFGAQHALEENGFSSHDQWRVAWRDARSRQFFVLGSGDETAGCQGCVLRPMDGDGFALRVRLPNHAQRTYVETTVAFAYGADVLRDALAGHRAISYRFICDAEGWRVFASTKPVGFRQISQQRFGRLGLDLNIDHVAVALASSEGNRLATRRVPLCTYGRSANGAKDAIGIAVGKIVAMAVGHRVPLAIERLDFSRKKTRLRAEYGARYARMLSSFAYARFFATLRARAHDAGIVVHDVDPAYTSFIGKKKFSTRYGLSAHQSAALVIARRSARFSERPNRRDRGASRAPARKRGESVRSYWRRISKPEKTRGCTPRSAARSGDPHALDGTAYRAVRGPRGGRRKTSVVSRARMKNGAQSHGKGIVADTVAAA